jgi:heme exporter protein B
MSSNISQILILLRKDFLMDWRQKHPLTGILLYVTVSIYTVYLSFSALVTPAVWSALFWIILLFVTTMALAKSFLQEERRHLYYYFTVPSSILIISKLVYSFVYLLSIGLFGLLIYIVLLGMPTFSLGLFIVNFINGVLGLSAAFTMIASMAVHTHQKGNLMAVLGFPVIMPVLLLAITNSKKIVEGGNWESIDSFSLILISVNVIIVALSLILFPYSWKA